MSDSVQFEEDSDLNMGNSRNNFTSEPKKSFLIRVAMAFGAKNERQANVMLLTASIVFLLVAGVLFARLLGVPLPLIGSETKQGIDINALPENILEVGRENIR